MLKQFLWTVPFCSFFCGYLIINTLYSSTPLQTPSVVGAPLDQALQILSEHTLNTRLLAKKQDPDLPDGTIISQTPQPKTAIKPNQSVFLVVAKKPEKLPAPDLLGKSLNAIEEQLQELVVRHSYYFVHSNHPTNSCIAQIPKPNAPLQNNQVITYLSTGNNRPVLWPNMKHQKLDVVQEFLENYPVELSIVWPHDDQHNPSQYVITDQRPLAGTIISFNPENPIQVHLQVKALKD